MIIQRVEPLSLGKMLGAIYGILGFIVGLFCALFSLAFAGAPKAAGSPLVPGWFAAMFGVGAVVILPIVYGLFGLVGGVLSAFLYNVVARKLGGVAIETR